MKKSILTIAVLISGLFISSLLITGCGSKKEQTTEDHQHMDSDSTKQHDEMAMGYACPMHPEEKGKEGDSCSKCGMMLEEAKTDSTANHH
jgi:hypothetical protein